MSIFDLIEQQVALHREMFGTAPTHAVICRAHELEALSIGCTHPNASKAQGTTLCGLTVFRSPIPNHPPYVY